jgi:hypothetical protein
VKLKTLAVAGIAVGALYMAGQQGVQAVTTSALSAGHHGRVHGGTLGCAGLERLWEQAGGRPAAAHLAAEIAMAESSGRQYASLYNTNGTTDRGYWQINGIHGRLSTFDAYGNARSAVVISHNGRNWTPWVTYTRNMYEGRC